MLFKGVLIFSLILYILPGLENNLLNINGILKYYIYFILGGYYFLYQEKLDDFLKIDERLILFITFLITVLNLHPISPNTDMSNFFFAVTGILFSISLGKVYIKNKYSFLNHIFGFSFTIYLLSWFPQVFIRIIFYQILNFHWMFVLPISTVLGVYVPLVIGKVILELKKRKKLSKKISYVFGV